MTAWRGHALTALVALVLPSCGREGAAHDPDVKVARAWAVPASDVGVACADVGAIRVCWDARGAPSVVARTLPPRAPPTPLGFRCAGQGNARTCAARDDVGPFDCDAGVCTQRHPRQPDDGQWQCSDDSAAVICAGGEPAAGTVTTDTAPGWTCGLRRRSAARNGAAERVCVDLAPDFPEDTSNARLCRWSYETGPTRTCAPDPGAHLLGDRCDREAPCVAGALCVSGRCVPRRPTADCVIDSDCPGGSCRFGSCLETSP